jgi:protein-disulfide isomerase
MMKLSRIFAVVALGSVVLAGCKGQENADKPKDQAAPVEAAKVVEAPKSLVPETMPRKGAADALVTIIEISDFQCPFCSRVGPTIKKILETYPNDVQVVWANNPLGFHDRAKPAALAAMAAHRQGKFWEMHDKLFGAQRELTDANFTKWAGEIGLDAAKFGADMKDAALSAQIDREQAASTATGARGTPGFFINGKLLSGAQPFEAFDTEIKDALAKANAHKAAGKAGMELYDAAFAERDGTVGAKVLGYFFKGDTVVAAAPAEAAAEDTGPAKPPRDSYEIWQAPVDVKNDHILGNNDEALVTVVEFSDFECPFCSRGRTTIEEVKKEYGDKVRIVFRHHPLPFHKNARPAHKASIAAGMQGKFWQFHDKAFDNARELTEDNYKVWAKEIGLDMAKFEKDYADPKLDKQIEKDLEMAGAISVRGTPNFLINGRKVVGAQPLPVFKAVVDEELEKAAKQSLKGQAYYETIVASGKVFSELDGKVNTLKLDGLPYKGDKDAKVTIVEFSDFQCPFCSRMGDPLQQVVKNYGGKVKVVFGHYPLSFHQQAMPASIMAQEAFEQGGPDLFWKVHDALFNAQKELSPEKIAEVAKANGVDMAKVEANKAKHEATIKAAMDTATAAGVQGTPTMFINGRKYEPSAGYSAEAIGKTIDKVLAAK